MKHLASNIFSECIQKKVVIFITSTALISTICLINTSVSADIQVSNLIRVTLLGDSYSSGAGAGEYYGDKNAYRSHYNYAQHYVNWLNSQGHPSTLTNLAHSGHTTQQVLEEQIPQVDPGYNLIMMTVGGNDVGFGNIVKYCFSPVHQNPTDCRDKVDYANSKLQDVRNNTLRIFEQLEAKVSKDAQIVLVGYPRLSYKRNLILSETSKLNRKTYDAAHEVRTLGAVAKTTQLKLSQEWNKNHKMKVTYIDEIDSVFNSHEPDPLDGNDYRWINEFLETGGYKTDKGTTDARFSLDAAEFYHPNLIGYDEISKTIIRQIGVPRFKRDSSVAPLNDIDIVFVVDSTGSMVDNISAVRSKINEVARGVESRSSSFRFALIDYKDHPQFNPHNQNYLAKTDLNFTSKVSDLEVALGSLNYEGGNIGNTNASVYSGVMQAVNMTWRDGVKKIVVVIGDAPPRDPEPGTGYTAASVAKAAYEVDPVSVYGIDTGQLNSTSFQTLVTSSTGTTANASSPDQVSDLVNKAISSELNKPFAWIQGPYVAKVGDPVDIDAAASHAVSGSLTSYEWDFNGDGIYDETGTSPRITHTFSQEFSGVIGLRVTQSDGQTAVATTQVDITDDGDNTPRDQDNCPDVSNWGQTDYDNDGVGDECDPDPGFPTQDKPDVCVVGENCPPDIDASYKPTASAQTHSAAQTASPSPSSRSGVTIVRVVVLVLLGLLAGAAVLHYRRKVTS